MAEDKGWISIHRQIQDCFIWDKKPFSWGQAWIDLLLLVNHEDKKTYFSGKMITVGRGQRITSINKLAQRWGWSRHKVSDFLNILESEEMIIQNRDMKRTLITIVKYEVYQQSPNKKGQVKDKSRTSDGQVTDTNNNENNENNKLSKDNLYMGKPEQNIIPPTLEMVTQYCIKRGNGLDPESFVNFYAAKGWYIGKNKMKDWHAAIHTWERNNKTKPKDDPSESWRDAWANA